MHYGRRNFEDASDLAFNCIAGTVSHVVKIDGSLLPSLNEIEERAAKFRTRHKNQPSKRAGLEFKVAILVVWYLVGDEILPTDDVIEAELPKHIGVKQLVRQLVRKTETIAVWPGPLNEVVDADFLHILRQIRNDIKVRQSSIGTILIPSFTSTMFSIGTGIDRAG